MSLEQTAIQNELNDLLVFYKVPLAKIRELLKACGGATKFHDVGPEFYPQIREWIYAAQLKYAGNAPI